jgi:hypothetical protein
MWRRARGLIEALIPELLAALIGIIGAKLFGAVLGLVAGIVALAAVWLVLFLAERRAAARPPVPSSPTPAARVVIDLTPEELREQFDGKTDVQADALFALYRGKWMTLRGHIKNVARELTFWHVTLDEHQWPQTLANVACLFDSGWGQKLETLPIGTEVTIQGRIARRTSLGLTLDLCELR